MTAQKPSEPNLENFLQRLKYFLPNHELCHTRTGPDTPDCATPLGVLGLCPSREDKVPTETASGPTSEIHGLEAYLLD
jgi:hypothetical protein